MDETARFRRRAAFQGLLIASFLFLLIGPIGAGAAEEPPRAPEAMAGTDAGAPPPAITLLVLPSVRAAGQRETSPWTSPASGERFRRLEEAFVKALGELGYGVIPSAEALRQEAARVVLQDASRPLTPRWAAEAAGAAGAEIALVVRAEAIRSVRGGSDSAYTTDALVEALAYRAADGVRLARASTRVTGTGASEVAADDEALAHAARPLARLLAEPLATGAYRPLIRPRPLPIIIEGHLRWGEYRRLLGLLREAIPEIRRIEERRFSYDIRTLLALCGCEAADAAGRLDGRVGAGFKIEAKAEGNRLRLRVRALSFP
jgi:hypothetical protein